MIGTDVNEFSPQKTLTRAMLVQILAKFDSADLRSFEYESNFIDVKPSSWYARAVNWALSNGITAGLDSKHFAPNKGITRQECATFVYSYIKYRDPNIKDDNSAYEFTDYNTVSEWAKKPIGYLVENDIISGYEDGSVRPKQVITRAECALIVHKLTDILPCPVRILVNGKEIENNYVADINYDYYYATIPLLRVFKELDIPVVQIDDSTYEIGTETDTLYIFKPEERVLDLVIWNGKKLMHPSNYLIPAEGQDHSMVFKYLAEVYVVDNDTVISVLVNFDFRVHIRDGKIINIFTYVMPEI